MDSYNFQNVKAEKAKAVLRYRRLQRITVMFRFIELCVFLIVISRFTTQFPLVFKLSGEYFRGLTVTLISPRFVFVLGNVIVVVLFLKSRQLSAKDGGSTNAGKIDFYDEYVKTCEDARRVYNQEIKKQSKQGRRCVGGGVADVVNSGKEVKYKMHRSQSESGNLKRVVAHRCGGEPRRELRRSATETYRKPVNCGEKIRAAVPSYAEDEMSSEEFRRTVEAFIARQQKSLREEEEYSAIVYLET